MTSTDAERLEAARQALLRRRLSGGPKAGTAVPTVTRRHHTGPAPLSVSQRQFWYLNQLAPESAAYNEMVTVRKAGALDPDAFRWAFNEVVRRHQAWRTTFPIIDGEPRQRVHEPSAFELPLLDLTHLRHDEAERRAAELAVADTRVPYDLANGPLIRPRLVSLSADDHRLYLGMHHLYFDGVSLYRIVLPELVRLYDAHAAGRPAPLVMPALQYPDYAAWEVDWMRSPVVAARMQYWRRRLANLDPLDLPTDHPRPVRQRFRGGMVSLRIERDTVEALRALGQHHDATLFQVLAAAYAWWLHRYTGRADVVFATPCDLRRRPELDGLVGYCLTPLPIRLDVSGTPTLGDLIAKVRTDIIDGMDNVVPFEHLVHGLGVPHDSRMNPTFQVVLTLEPAMVSPDPQWSLHQMETGIGDQVGSAKLDLNLELDERPEGHLAGRFVYDSDLFERSSAEQMCRHWIDLLDAITRTPDQTLRELDRPIKPNLGHAAGPTRQHPRSQPPVHELILEQAARTPDAVAVVVDGRTRTYGELARHARAGAQRLVASGAGPETIVAVFLDRSCEVVEALLAVLISGAGYLPINPAQPATRTEFVLADAAAKLVVTRPELIDALPANCPPVITFDEAAVTGHEPAAPELSSSPDDLAYVIYTSGSTGNPKGVLIEHHSLTNLATTFLPSVGLSARDTLLSVAAYTFDMSVGDIFSTLCQGARLVLASAQQAADPAELARLVDTSDAGFMMATPTTWSALLDSGWSGNGRLTALSGGEPLPPRLAGRLLACCAAVWNLYGPTEATVWATGVQLDAADSVTVGRPLPGSSIYVLDSRDRPLPDGVPGEIVIGGAGVARGYMNRPEETTDRFRLDPFATTGRMYRTGDRGRLLADGRLQHLGRLDDQVKVRGFRIEPGEIEAALTEHPAVTASAVVAQPNEQDEPELVAYIVGTDVSDPELRAWVRTRLPDYMVPTTVVALAELPVTASGKLDRRALQGPRIGSTLARSEGQAPRTPTEKRLIELWSTALHTEVTDVHADFFDLGGHSVLAARLINDTGIEFDQPVRLVDFIDHGTTIAGLAALLDGTLADSADAAPSAKPLFLVYPDHVSAVSLRHLVHIWGPEQPVHPLVPDQPGGWFAEDSTAEGLAAVLTQQIRRAQPHGPYALVGFSLGGLLAYEVARQLSVAGEPVGWLGLLDTPAPTFSDLLLRQMNPWHRLRALRGRSRQYQWAKIREVAVRSIKHGPNAPSPEEHFDMRGALRISKGYARPGHELPLELVTTADTVAAIGDETVGWGDYHRGPVTVHALPGDHDTLLDQPQVNDVARMLLGGLQRSRTARATPSGGSPGTGRRQSAP